MTNIEERNEVKCKGKGIGGFFFKRSSFKSSNEKGIRLNIVSLESFVFLRAIKYFEDKFILAHV